ncbi:DNA sulfur modification protein DndD [Sphingomonas sp. ZB1N12]|uniref:DNA sulfur modification protein DndD n=1 Tax=Sphingomonas arabinosi TaxID=3096160 RepID=UPI002FCA94F7
MILDELVLHDFGVYGGRQSLTLTPSSSDKPIVLVGGLNGGGKTTILEALQLCLFGGAAPSAARSAGGYEEHLRRRIHRGTGVQEAGVELAFRHTSNGVEQSYRVVRSWAVGRGGSCRETLEILRDGRIDRLATDNWPEQVEEFMPARIASLFLFDGEKVESYADPEEAPALIATAVHNLLGLDIVERLGMDLSALERRKRVDATGPQVVTPADEARDDLERRREQRLALQRELAANNDALDRANRDLRTADERFRREGGDLYAVRDTLEANAAAAARHRSDEERQLRETAAGAAPLLMVHELLAAVAERDRHEQDTAGAAGLAAILQDEHLAMLRLPHIAALKASARSEIETALSGRREQHALVGARDVHLALSSEARLALVGLTGDELGELRHDVQAALARAADVRRADEDAGAALAAIPSAGALEDLSSKRTGLQAEVARLEQAKSASEAALADADRDIAQLREREAKLAEADALERFKGEDADRVLLHSARVRGTLLRFREAVIARHVSRIETLVLESFQRLVRKPGLISELAIDPVTFALQLTAGDGHVMVPGQLSAGERQLLAVAILWGLAKASGRPLPTVIDTPLGRLDSHHRSRLVERYFPHASHQVILLSTDEEISGPYHAALLPFIGRSYRLEFDEAARRTVIEDGYLNGDTRLVA